MQLIGNAVPSVKINKAVLQQRKRIDADHDNFEEILSLQIDLSVDCVLGVVVRPRWNVAGENLPI
jgi:hypothetical protein